MLLLLAACVEAYTILGHRQDYYRPQVDIWTTFRADPRMGPTKSPTTAKLATKVATNRKVRWRLKGTPDEEVPTTTIAEPSTKPAFTLPKINMPVVSLPELAELPELPPLPELPFSFPSRAAPEATAADEPPMLEAPSVPEPSVAEASPVKSVARAASSMINTFFMLVFSKLQLAFLRRVRGVQSKVDQVVSDVEAAPQRALAAAKRAAFLLPFYAKAAAEIAYEDAERAMRAAPGRAKEQLQASVYQAQASVNDAFEAAKAAPEQWLSSLAASLKSELDAAQAQADGLLDQARVARDKLNKLN